MGGDGEKKGGKEEGPKFREWSVRHLEWGPVDEKTFERWRKSKDRPIPKDAKVLASMKAFRRDDEKSVTIINLGERACGVRFSPGKDELGSFTRVGFYYSPGDPKKTSYLGGGRDVYTSDREFKTGEPMLIWFNGAHGLKGSKSWAVRALVLTVKDIDQKAADKAFGELAEDPKHLLDRPR
jgi:hypothetical protein